jgi:hypothetical protein
MMWHGLAKGEYTVIQIHELGKGHLERLLPLLEAYIREIGEGSLAEGSAGRIGEAIDNGKIYWLRVVQGVSVRP